MIRPIPGADVITWLADSRVPQQSYLSPPPFQARFATPADAAGPRTAAPDAENTADIGAIRPA